MKRARSTPRNTPVQRQVPRLTDMAILTLLNEGVTTNMLKKANFPPPIIEEYNLQEKRYRKNLADRKNLAEALVAYANRTQGTFAGKKAYEEAAKAIYNNVNLRITAHTHYPDANVRRKKMMGMSSHYNSVKGQGSFATLQRNIRSRIA